MAEGTRPAKVQRLETSSSSSRGSLSLTSSWRSRVPSGVKNKSFAGAAHQDFLFLREQLGVLVKPNEILKSRFRVETRTEVFPVNFHLPVKSVASINADTVLCVLDITSQAMVCRRGVDAGVIEAHGERVVVPAENAEKFAVLAGKGCFSIFDAERADVPLLRSPSDFYVPDADISMDGRHIIAVNRCEGMYFDLRMDAAIPTFRNLFNINDEQKGPSGWATPKVRLLTGTPDRCIIHRQDSRCYLFDMRMVGRQHVRDFFVSGPVQQATWCATTNQWLPANVLHPIQITTMTAIGDGDLFLTGAEGDGQRLWSCSTGRSIEHFPAALGTVEAVVTASSVGIPESFYSMLGDGFLQLAEWSLKDPVEPLAVFDAPGAHRFRVPTSLALRGGSTFEGVTCGTQSGHFLQWTPTGARD